MNYVAIIAAFLFILVMMALVGGVGFAFQTLLCAKVQRRWLRMIGLVATGAVLLVCTVMWLFDLPSTVYITGPGKLAVYDHIIVAVFTAPAFMGMEAAWLMDKRMNRKAQTD